MIRVACAALFNSECIMKNDSENDLRKKRLRRAENIFFFIAFFAIFLFFVSVIVFEFL